MSIYKKFQNLKMDITVVKDATNPFAKSKYASLSNVFEEVTKKLNNNNLLFTIIEIILLENGNYQAKSLLINLDSEKEEKIEFVHQFPPDSTQKSAIQCWGSTLTYAQRYIYGSVFSIAYDDEDPEQKQLPAKTESKPTNKPSENQMKRLFALINVYAKNQNKTVEDVKNNISNRFKLDSFNDMSIQIYNKICESLDKANQAVHQSDSLPSITPEVVDGLLPDNKPPTKI